MGANFIPSLNGYTGQGAFRFWCQKVLPLVYDDSLSYYELLNKVVEYLNNVITDVSTMGGNIDELKEAVADIQALNANVLDDLVERTFYNEITVETTVENNSNCFFVTIPLNDNEGNLIKPYVAKSTEYTPLQYAQKNGTTLTTNTGISLKTTGNAWLTGNFIGNGEVLNSYNIQNVDNLISKGAGYLTISEDRQVYKDYPITTTIQTLTADTDVYNCFTYYCKMVESGEPLDVSQFLTNEGNPITGGTVPMMFGITADKTIIIGNCDGRTNINSGMTTAQFLPLMLERGCVDVWLLDGGGSSNITILESKINQNYDNDRTTDRNIHYTFNVKKEGGAESVIQTFAKIGEEKQRTLAQIMPFIAYNESRLETVNGRILSDVDKTSMAYLTNVIGAPTSSDDGFFASINRSDGKNKMQMWTPALDSKEIYIRKANVNNVFGDWRVFYSGIQTGDTLTMNLGVYTGQISGAYIYFVLPIAGLFYTDTSNVTGTWGDQTDAGLRLYLSDGTDLLNSGTTKLKPTFDYLRAYGNFGLYVRFAPAGLTQDANYIDRALVLVSMARLNLNF